MKIIVATNNRGKLEEIEQIMTGKNVKLSTLSDEGIKAEFDETGTTFEENALIKARTVYNIVHKPVISDDSGLCVDALLGAPGIYTSRYFRENAKDDENISKLLNAMKDVPTEKRSAKFVCVIAYIDELGKEHVYRGECGGEISFERMGRFGMGYDPVFYYPPYERTFAQCSDDEKNAVSHRNEALSKFLKDIEIK